VFVYEGDLDRVTIYKSLLVVQFECFFGKFLKLSNTFKVKAVVAKLSLELQRALDLIDKRFEVTLFEVTLSEVAVQFLD